MSDWQQNMAKLGRLKKRQEFLDIQLKGQSWVSSSVIVQILPERIGRRVKPQQAQASAQPDVLSRMGLTVSKKVSALAVERNRIKRRLRAAAGDVLGARAQDGADYVLIGRKATLDVDFEVLKKDLSWCLKRLHHKLEAAEPSKDRD
jgi:ribonuclease P protein component